MSLITRGAHPHPKVSDGLLPEPVGALHAHDVVAWLGEDMGDGRESVFRVLLNIAIGFGRAGCAIAKGPDLFAIRGAERPDLEGDRLSRRDIHGGPVRCLN